MFNSRNKIQVLVQFGFLGIVLHIFSAKTPSFIVFHLKWNYVEITGTTYMLHVQIHMLSFKTRSKLPNFITVQLRWPYSCKCLSPRQLQPQYCRNEPAQGKALIIELQPSKCTKTSPLCKKSSSALGPIIACGRCSSSAVDSRLFASGPVAPITDAGSSFPLPLPVYVHILAASWCDFTLRNPTNAFNTLSLVRIKAAGMMELLTLLMNPFVRHWNKQINPNMFIWTWTVFSSLYRWTCLCMRKHWKAKKLRGIVKQPLC